jgi:Transcription factor IIIC subunit delta N-term
MDAPDSAFDPVILSGWPSCTDCISWSSDGELAIAAGGLVHVLTPKQASTSGSQSDAATTGLRQWHSARIHTNTFTQWEWPDQEQASFHTFSVGEEQSLSIVVGLSWSPPGIGPHRRSVLAVLTSNHILSLWESNGATGEWIRGCVVNHSLGEYFGWVDDTGKDVYREKRRIRAFAWSPPYRDSQAGVGTDLASKWGLLYLGIANDEEALIILRVRKLKLMRESEWSLQITNQVNLASGPADTDPPHAGSLFQKAMSSRYPISNLSWSELQDKTSESFIQVEQHRRKTSIIVQARLDMAETTSIDICEHHLGLDKVHREDVRQQDVRCDLQDLDATMNAELRKKIEEARIDFDSDHNLDDNSRVREWGFASNGTQVVACITIHPSDMGEYTIASMEKCTLLFAPNAKLMDSARPQKMATANPTDSLFEVVNWILSAANGCPLGRVVDRYLLGISATHGAHSNDEGLMQKARFALARLRETSDSQLDLDEMEVDEAESAESLTGSDIEKCLICEAIIPFDENDIEKARCETGHQYSTSSRSHLVIVADQGQHDASCLYLLFKSQGFLSTVLVAIANF